MNQAIEKKIPKARWFYLLPTFFLVNFFGFMDRQVIAFALPGGMMEDLALSATIAGFASGIFAAGALFLQVPAGQLAQKGKVKSFITFSIIAWSIFSLLTGLVQNEWQLLGVRFLLGVFEGALSPAVVTLITFWFPDKNGERVKATSVFFTAVSASGILTGPLAGMIIEISDWRTLYIILGIVGIITAVLWVVFVTERPETAKWLSKEERDYIVKSIKEEREMVKKMSNIEVKSDKLQLGQLLRNKYVWILCIIGFCVNVGQFGFSMWMPMMIQDITKSGIAAVGWISIIPNLAIVVGLWTWTYLASKIRDRRLTTGTPLLLLGGFLVIGTFISGNPVIGIGLMCLTAFFIQGHMPSFYSLPSLLLVKEHDGPARGLIGVAMGFGAFVGPYIVGVLISLLGSTVSGMYVLALVLAVGFFVSFLLPKNIGVKQNDLSIEKQDNLETQISSN